MMTLFEGIVIANLFVLCWVAYEVGKVKADVQILYEGLGSVITDLDELENK
jgi:hypothetical protein